MHTNQPECIRETIKMKSFDLFIAKLKLCYKLLNSKKVLLVTNYVDEEGNTTPGYVLDTVNLKNDELALISSKCYSNAIYNFQVDQAITELIAD